MNFIFMFRSFCHGIDSLNSRIVWIDLEKEITAIAQLPAWRCQVKYVVDIQ